MKNCIKCNIEKSDSDFKERSKKFVHTLIGI